MESVFGDVEEAGKAVKEFSKGPNSSFRTHPSIKFSSSSPDRKTKK